MSSPCVVPRCASQWAICFLDSIDADNSDELNGITTDNEGVVRPLLPRRFSRLSEAAAENAQSRLYLGVHWAFDATEGIAMGNAIGDYVFRHALRPARR